MPNVLSMSGAEHAAIRVGIDAEVAPRCVDTYVDALTRPIVRDYIERLRGQGRG